MKTREDNRKEIKNALTCFIGKLIHFKDENFDENIDNAGSIFRGTHVTDNDEGILLWDNEYRYVTLQYALENSIKDSSKNNEDYFRADDAATYWKENFENLYNDIAKALITDGEEMTDGECVDAIFYALKKYEGESDELTEVNFDGLN